jgi:hypothetical protein
LNTFEECLNESRKSLPKSPIGQVIAYLTLVIDRQRKLAFHSDIGIGEGVAAIKALGISTGSGNMAEIETSVLAKQFLDRRLNAMERVASELSIRVRQRNRRRVTIRWTFRHADG